MIATSEGSRVDKSPAHISPFLANVLTSLATELSAKTDLNQQRVITNCGYIDISTEGPDTIYVAGLYIDSDKQRQGCGTSILEGLAAVMARLSTSTMTIRLWPVRSAIGFYLKNGFQLIVDSSQGEEYYLERDKLFGDDLQKYTAKTRLAIAEKVGVDSPWTHEVLWPIFEKSGFPSSNPMFYSFWVSDITRGDSRVAERTVQPSKGRRMSNAV